MKYCVIFYSEIDGFFYQYARESVKMFDDLSEAEVYGRQVVSKINEFLENVCFCNNVVFEV